MEYGKGQGPYTPQNLPGRRTREERRSLSETLADGTSKFFSSMVAKKNGLFSDLSSKIENTFAPKTDTISNSTGSDCSTSPPNTPSIPNTPPPRPPPPKRLPSMGSSREKENVTMKRMSSMPAYTRTDSRPEIDDYRHPPQSIARPLENDRNFSKVSAGGSGKVGEMMDENKTKDSRYIVDSGVNISFDEPIYGQRETNLKKTIPVNANLVSEQYSNKANRMNNRDGNFINTDSKTSPSWQESSTPKNGAGKRSDSSGQKESTRFPTNPNQPFPPSSQNPAVSSTSPPPPKPAPRSQKQQPKPVAPEPQSPSDSTYINQSHSKDGQGYQSYNSSDYGRGGMSREINKSKSSSSGEWSDRGGGHVSMDSNRSHPESSSGSNSGGEGANNRKRAPKFTTTNRRSSTVDEMLFDDYVEPDVDEVITTDPPPENLMNFEAEDTNENAGGLTHTTSVDSSDVEYGGTLVHRSGSLGSDKSWSSNYSVDSQPDDVTLECMEFMKSFVDMVFHDRLVLGVDFFPL